MESELHYYAPKSRVETVATVNYFPWW